ncbi:MAG TPA: hypothetical protein VJH03_10820 [Blastocatellia bacterium]|nr:hypothetical protein [Blastocatellia bacterium]
MGKATCLQCGATVGTVFSESTEVRPFARTKYRQTVSEQVSSHRRIEAAQERANNALALALASFFCPGLGFLMGVTSIYLGARAAQTLRECGVEEGRGLALAAIVIGVIVLIAQVSLVIYFIRVGIPL